jgi:hypothetical protein
MKCSFLTPIQVLLYPHQLYILYILMTFIVEIIEYYPMSVASNAFLDFIYLKNMINVIALKFPSSS